MRPSCARHWGASCRTRARIPSACSSGWSRRRSRHRGLARAALLRVRRRRHVAGRHGGRLDDLGLGPERRPRGALAGRRRGRGGVRGLARRPARAAGGRERRLRHRRRRARTRPASRRRATRCCATPAGTWRSAAWSARRPSTWSSARRRTSTIFSSLRLLGLGAGRARRIPADDQGRMDADALAARSTRARGPAIVCAQAGEINTGSFDPFEPIADACAARGAWLHVDGAFGLWAAATPRLRGLVRRRRARALVGHRCAQVAQRALRLRASPSCATRRSTAPRCALTASYFVETDAGRDAFAYVPETSRRARGFPIYAALRALGRSGVAELVQGCCDRARRMAAALEAGRAAGAQRRRAQPGAGGRWTTRARCRRVLARVQDDGTCWVGGTTWKGRAGVPRLVLELVDHRGGRAPLGCGDNGRRPPGLLVR